jgi:membrane-associated phospholipid phosphatase
MPVGTDTSTVGLVWIPYVVAGLCLAALAGFSLYRRRSGNTRLAEFLLVRGGTLLVIGVVLGLLGDAAAEGDGLTAIDQPVWSWMVAHRSDALTRIAVAITTVGSTVAMAVIAAVVVVLLVIRGRRGDAALVAVVAAGAGLLVVVAKPVVGRLRPPEEYRLVIETNQSFPSGHAVASSAIIGVLCVVFVPMIDRQWLRVVVVLAASLAVVLIGVSRLYLGVHWATDILGGWLTGIGWLLMCVSVRDVWTTFGLGRRVLPQRTATSGDRIDER